MFPEGLPEGNMTSPRVNKSSCLILGKEINILFHAKVKNSSASKKYIYIRGYDFASTRLAELKTVKILPESVIIGACSFQGVSFCFSPYTPKTASQNQTQSYCLHKELHPFFGTS